MRDEFQNDNHNDDFGASSAAALVSVDAAGSDHMVAEYQPVARASCVQSANFYLYSTRS